MRQAFALRWRDPTHRRNRLPAEPVCAGFSIPHDRAAPFPRLAKRRCFAYDHSLCNHCGARDGGPAPARSASRIDSVSVNPPKAVANCEKAGQGPHASQRGRHARPDCRRCRASDRCAGPGWDAHRAALDQHKLAAAAPYLHDWRIKITKRSRAACGIMALPWRRAAERTDPQLGRSRRLAKGWEAFASIAKAWRLIAPIRIMIRRLTRPHARPDDV